MSSAKTGLQEPPEGVPHLVTGTLKYWLVKHPPNPGRQASVVTSDPSISMHVFGGGRDIGLTHLFIYHGFEIGFLLNRPAGVTLPEPQHGPAKDLDAGTFTSEVTHIGTPVVDVTRAWARDEFGVAIKTDQGMNRLDQGLLDAGAHFVTGVDWADYAAGRGTKFPSLTMQNEMTAIWLDLLRGLLGELSNIGRDTTGQLLPNAVFSDKIRAQLDDGSLIDGDT